MLGAKQVEINLNNKIIKLETGKIAKQADSSVLVTCEETTVLVTVVSSEEPRENIDFFPLLVDYEEKFYAAGKIPGGFFKREGKPSENAILISRLIDRPLRPLFPKEYRNDVQIIATVLSYDHKNLPDVLAVVGASTALWLSNIPIQDTIGAVRIGLINNELIINPTVQELENSDLDLIVAGNKDSIIMMEGESKEISEETLLKAIEFSQISIKNIIKAQDQLLNLLNLSKQKKELLLIQEQKDKENIFYNKIKDDFGEKIKEALCVFEKKERSRKLKEIQNQIMEIFSDAEENNINIIQNVFDKVCKQIVRNMIIEEKIRVDNIKSANSSIITTT